MVSVCFVCTCDSGGARGARVHVAGRVRLGTPPTRIALQARTLAAQLRDAQNLVMLRERALMAAERRGAQGAAAGAGGGHSDAALREQKRAAELQRELCTCVGAGRHVARRGSDGDCGTRTLRQLALSPVVRGHLSVLCSFAQACWAV